MDIDLRDYDQVKVVKLRGKLSLGEPVESLRSTFEQIFAAGQSNVVVDLEEVPMVDSSGIGLLVKTLTSAKQKGGSLKLLKPAKFTVQTLKLVGLINLFDLFDDREQAVASSVGGRIT